MESNKLPFKKNLLNCILFSGILIGNTFYAQEGTSKTKENIDIPRVVSYRSASCGCCKKWLNHLRDNELEVVDNIVENISEIKQKYNVPNNLRSCHTAKIGNYKIEGHVPIESINTLFKEKAIISGLAVPGMPHGSPGMETHSHNYETYKVVSFSNSGNTKILDTISP